MKNQSNITKNVYFQCFVSLLRRKCQKADKVPYTRNVYYERFLSFLGTKTQNALFVFYMEEQNNITKNVYLRVFYTVRYKNAKMYKNTLYEKRQHLQKHIFSVFKSVLRTKTLKRMKSSLYGKTKHHQKRLFSIFGHLYIKTLKCL